MPNNSVRRLGEYKCKHCDIWYIRFGMDYYQRFLAVGNKLGEVFVWDIDTGRNKSPTKIGIKGKAAAVRQVAFDQHGKYLVAVCDDASVWVWKRKTNENARHVSKSRTPSTRAAAHPTENTPLPAAPPLPPSLSSSSSSSKSANGRPKGQNERKLRSKKDENSSSNVHYLNGSTSRRINAHSSSTTKARSS
eukprot:CAMPEP_0185258746 /NCGR_PEP_ID=MMETSP1359-20130426/7617_1 /TAXON_ID=552665 /ORGANISM="Bigelowiella longifila, Strain CCMP242" /LENGTH=190 /DNA_ID=CAMNT_0027844355 /DNA_START=119 /DNA_END=691 /DNA_ORIENTATION=+